MGIALWLHSHIASDTFKAFVAADLWRAVSACLSCVVAIEADVFRDFVGTVDDVLLWRGKGRLLRSRS